MEDKRPMTYLNFTAKTETKTKPATATNKTVLSEFGPKTEDAGTPPPVGDGGSFFAVAEESARVVAEGFELEDAEPRPTLNEDALEKIDVCGDAPELAIAPESGARTFFARSERPAKDAGKPKSGSGIGLLFTKQNEKQNGGTDAQTVNHCFIHRTGSTVNGGSSGSGSGVCRQRARNILRRFYRRGR
jgi:hypothetical protein